MTTTPYVVSDSNLSHAWARVLWHVAKTPGPDICPLIMSIDCHSACNFDP